LLFCHLSAFYFHLDPCQNCHSYEESLEPQSSKEKQNLQSQIRSNWSYMIALCCSALTQLDTLFIMVRAKFQLNAPEMETTLTHKIFVRKFWGQGDVLMNMAFTMNVLVYAILIFKPPQEWKYRLFCFRENGFCKVVSNG